MSAFRASIVMLVMIFVSFTMQAGTYSNGSDSLDMSFFMADPISVTVDGGGSLSFNNLVPGDEIDASLNYNISATEGRSITCLFKRTGGGTFSVGTQARVNVRTGNTSSSPSLPGTYMFFTLNSCNIGDNSMTMIAAISTLFEPSTSYYVPNLAIIVSYDAQTITEYT